MVNVTICGIHTDPMGIPKTLHFNLPAMVLRLMAQLRLCFAVSHWHILGDDLHWSTWMHISSKQTRIGSDRVPRTIMCLPKIIMFSMLVPYCCPIGWISKEID